MMQCKTFSSDKPQYRTITPANTSFYRDGVYGEPIRDLEELKQRLVNNWANVKQSVVGKAVT